MTPQYDLWPAPAKLNLFLHITGRRDDGYHELQTLFQLIDYQDQLGFRIRSDGKISRINALDTVSYERDLSVRAAQLLKKSTGCALGVDIYLEKNIPMGSGMGGGSSDAATTLVALNRLWHLNLSKTRLMALGAQLGADVPIFVGCRSAWAEGIGEKIAPQELPDYWYVVIFPGVMVPTGKLFGDPELTRDARPIKIRDYFAGGTVNAFEPIVRRKYPAVNAAVEWLSIQAVSPSINSVATPRMTGTGSCIFAGYADEVSAITVVEKSKAECPNDWRIILAKSCNESPLAHKLKTTASH